MCLIYSEEATQRFLEDATAARRPRIVAWKVLQHIGGGLISPYYHPDWSPGWMQSDRPDDAQRPEDGDRVDRGIHVYLTRPGADHPWESVVPVTCRLRDLVGVGVNEPDGAASAVFTKVFLSKLDYTDAVKK